MAIIGAGELGGAVAHALASREAISHIVLIDPAASAAAGKALDIQQMGAITGAHTQLRGTADLSEALGCVGLIVADQFRTNAGEWRGAEGLEQLRTIASMLRDAPVVLAGADQTDLLAQGVRETGIARRRILGSAPEAFASALRAIVALEARCAPFEVMLSVLGAPPDGFVVPWSEAGIGGYALTRVLTPVQLSRVEGRAGRLWPPRPYALGLAAAMVTEGLLQSGRRAYNVLAMLDGELGVRGRVSAVPAFLDAGGLAGLREPSLSVRERVQFETALGG